MKKINSFISERGLIILLLVFTSGVYSFGETNMEKNTDIKLTLSGEREVVFRMLDNASSRDFISMLPAVLEFEDYSRTEKVSNPPSSLTTEGAPSGHNPEVGDFCMYGPWGNLCIFYRDFGYAAGLIKLGTVVSGEDYLDAIEGSVKIEVIQQK